MLIYYLVVLVIHNYKEGLVITRFNCNFHSQCELSWATYFVLCLTEKNETLNGNYIFIPTLVVIVNQRNH